MSLSASFMQRYYVIYLRRKHTSAGTLYVCARPISANLMFGVTNDSDQKPTSHLEQFGKSLVDMMGKQRDELWSKITEVDVERWARLVDAERECLSVAHPIDCC